MFIAAYGKEVLHCSRDASNTKYPYTVSVIKSGTGVVGHLPKKISTASFVFIRRGGSITCKVTGSRCYSGDLPQGGMEIPYLLEFRGSVEDAKRPQKLTCITMDLLDAPSNVLPPAPNQKCNDTKNAKRKIEEKLKHEKSVLDSEKRVKHNTVPDSKNSRPHSLLMRWMTSL